MAKNIFIGLVIMLTLLFGFGYGVMWIVQDVESSGNQRKAEKRVFYDDCLKIHSKFECKALAKQAF